MTKKIGVFDSGIGGKSIAESLHRDIPSAEIIYVDDAAHMPYGSREQQDIIELTDAAIQPLLSADCNVIVLACNTATAAAIDALREKYPDIPFVGLEPMVKTAAAMTATGTIAICATPFTLRSDRYIQLKEKYTQHLEVVEPNCSTWAAMIEKKRIDEYHIATLIEAVCNSGADVIVLACTHYHWIKELIVTVAAGRATIIDPSDAISRRVSVILGLTP